MAFCEPYLDAETVAPVALNDALQRKKGREGEAQGTG
jgi:hypothetical protein